MENRYFYRDESTSKQERRLTVAYQIDKDTGVVTYAASMYRKNTPSERSFRKSEHRATSAARLLLRPNTFTLDPTPLTSSERWANIEEQIRRQIRLNGVSGPRDGRFLNESGEVVYAQNKPNNSFNQSL